jgi:hypothetical protein
LELEKSGIIWMAIAKDIAAAAPKLNNEICAFFRREWSS